MIRQLTINGGNKLSGSVTISGAKNAALPLLASTILASNEVKISKKASEAVARRALDPIAIPVAFCFNARISATAHDTAEAATGKNGNCVP